MQLFHNDYNVMCHPAVMAGMAAAANEQVAGYGVDHYCEGAAKRIMYR